jgi:drug/metabolite transporter (DMT)-like permease
LIRGSPESDSSPAAWAAFVSCCLVWSSTFLFISIGDDTVPAVWAASLRLALAAVILITLARLSRQGLPRGAALRAAAGFGFFNFGVNFPLLYWGEKVFPSGLTAVLFATIPLSTAMFAALLGMERLSIRKVTGALIALAGVLVIFSHLRSGPIRVTTLAAVAIAATATSLGAVLLKRGPRQPPIGANAIGTLVGLPFCLGASFALGEPHRLPTGFREWGPILYLTLASSVGAYVLISWLIHHWDVSRTSFIGVVTPVFALLLGALVRHEHLSVTSSIGSAIVLAGVILGMRQGRAAPVRSSADHGSGRAP